MKRVKVSNNVIRRLPRYLRRLDELTEEGEQIWPLVQEDFNSISGGHGKLAAYAFMIFNLLCAPCFAAIGAIKREMNNRGWTWFAIAYQCGFAYLVAFVINQIGGACTGHLSVIGLILAVAVVACAIWLLFRPYKESNRLTTDVKVTAK